MKDFFFTLFAWLLTLPCLIGALVFALYNADIIPVTVNPFMGPQQMPVYVPVLAAIAFGFFFGCLMTWAAMGRLRKEKRDQAKRIKTLEKEIQAANNAAPPSNNYTMLPSSFLDRK